MSVLELYKFDGGREGLLLKVACASMAHVSRFAGLFPMFGEIVCNYMNPKRADEISLKTQIIYLMIYMFEVADCLTDEQSTYYYLNMIPSAIFAFLTLVIILGILLLSEPEELENKDGYNWIYIIIMTTISFVLAQYVILDGKEFCMIFSSCLSVFAMIPQFHVFQKAKRIRLIVGFFMAGMFFVPITLIAGVYEMNRVLGLESEYHQIIFVGATLLVTVLCLCIYYPKDIINSAGNKNRRNGQILNNEGDMELLSFPPNVVGQSEQREATKAAGDDNNQGGSNAEEEDVTERTKMIDPQLDVVVQAAKSVATNGTVVASDKADVEAGKDEKKDGLDEEEQDVTETTKMIDSIPKIVVQEIDS